MKPQVCPFCSSSISLVDSAKVYRRSYGLSTFVMFATRTAEGIAIPIVTQESVAIQAAPNH